MTQEEIELMRQEMKREEQGFGRWSWFAIMEKLANGDVTKFEAVSKQNFVLCLNLLSYWKERDEYRENIEKQMRQQAKTH